MARFQMKQDWISFGKDYTILRENGDVAYRIDGHVFSIGDKLTIEDPDGNELALVTQKLLSWGKTYEVWRGDEKLAIVKKSVFTMFRCEFTIDVPGPGDFVAEGDFFEKEYEFRRDGDLAAHVSKGFFSLRDVYGIDVAAGVDPLLIVAGAVVIDLCCHDTKDHNH